MLERLDRRTITLLDVVALCNREATSLRDREEGNSAVVQQSTSHVLQIILCNYDLTVNYNITAYLLNHR